MKKATIKTYLWFLTILWFLILIGFVMIFSPIKIHGNSMENSYKNNQILWGLNYRLKNPFNHNFFGPKLFSIQRNDVLVIDSKKFENMEKRQNNAPNPLIKRVIALPKETIEIKKHVVFLNGKVLHETYISKSHFFDNVTGQITNKSKFPYLIRERMFRNNTLNNQNISVRLGNDQFFAMGDNRNYSWDSRVYGSFNINNEVKAKIIHINLPILFVKALLTIGLVVLTIILFILELN
ncbi:signal peptidase I [Bombilactobacillus mellis]|uniref:signal peptidase I n=1 Tax=Bombilactobacillus mellis TaxID=1218508 RepID=UPI002246ABBC|nr:signal peptidase I [Bombilactobacillus mellis]MCX0278476.1 signal peptidase I [Bombilactobacillus mellis]